MEDTQADNSIHPIFENSSSESDEELRVAVQEGRLKPGITVEVDERNFPIYDSRALKSKLSMIRLNLPWVERLDVSSEFKPYVDLDEEQKNAEENDNPDETLVRDDIKRELSIMQQAQASVLEAIPRLRSLGVPTDRPSDYFAQMAKSDIHMAKVRQRLSEKKAQMAEKQRIRQLRTLRKVGRKTQIIVEQQKATERRELNELVKKCAGDEHSMKLLKEKLERKKGRSSKVSRKIRAAKDRKYSMGGKKRGMKRNTAESSAGMVSSKMGRRKPINKRKGKKGKTVKRK